MDHPLLVVLLVFLFITFAIVALVVTITSINRYYRNFALNHSGAIKELRTINNHYKFNIIKNYDFVHAYDNRNFFDDISTQDYLIYQLIKMQGGVLKAINDTNTNKAIYDKYWKEIQEKCVFFQYGTNELPRNIKKLHNVEKKCFYKLVKNPTRVFSIHVCLKLTDLYESRYFDSKSSTFSVSQIKSLIGRINNKRGTYYLDKEIWDARCRVERGKVSNKMRFSIYDRDGHRCRKCGRRTGDLEIDHIIPIAKGGESTYDNLQTLCKSCNKKKGANIE